MNALERARLSAYAPGDFVGQESFMTAGEIRELAVQAGIGPGVTVLDLCCGVAGPGRFLVQELLDEAVGQVELMTGRPGPTAAMAAALMAAAGERRH